MPPCRLAIAGLFSLWGQDGGARVLTPQELIVKAAMQYVKQGDPLEADALLKNFCEICFSGPVPPCYASHPDRYLDCPVEPFIQQIMPLCEAQRKSERRGRSGA